jgi:hypothetical protein
VTADPGLVLLYFVFFVGLLQALLVKAQVVTPACNRCGLPVERKRMGAPACDCDRVHSHGL